MFHPVRISLSNVPTYVVRIRHFKGYFAVALQSKHPTLAYLRHYSEHWLFRISLLQFHTVLVNLIEKIYYLSDARDVQMLPSYNTW